MSTEQMSYTIDIEREDDGRWIAEIVDLPGVMAYGSTRDEAITKVKVLGLRVIADRIEESRSAASMSVSFAA